MFSIGDMIITHSELLSFTQTVIINHFEGTLIQNWEWNVQQTLHYFNANKFAKKITVTMKNPMNSGSIRFYIIFHTKTILTIQYIYIHPTDRCKGIASSFVEKCKQIILGISSNRLSCIQVLAYSNIAEDSIGALFWAKKGFKFQNKGSRNKAKTTFKKYLLQKYQRKEIDFKKLGTIENPKDIAEFKSNTGTKEGENFLSHYAYSGVYFPLSIEGRNKPKRTKVG